MPEHAHSLMLGERCHSSSGPPSRLKPHFPAHSDFSFGAVKLAIRARIRSAPRTRKADRTICVALTQARLCEFDERSVSGRACRTKYADAVYAGDGNCQLAHLSGADEAVREAARSLEWEAAVCCRSGQYLVGRQRRRSQVRPTSYQRSSAGPGKSALPVDRTVVGRHWGDRSLRHQVGSLSVGRVVPELAR